jgi:hypothetical protein
MGLLISLAFFFLIVIPYARSLADTKTEQVSSKCNWSHFAFPTSLNRVTIISAATDFLMTACLQGGLSTGLFQDSTVSTQSWVTVCFGDRDPTQLNLLLCYAKMRCLISFTNTVVELSLFSRASVVNKSISAVLLYYTR